MVETFPRKNPASLMILYALGGDEAPISGASFLLLMFAEEFVAALKLRWHIRFILKLMSEVKILEGDVFKINVAGNHIYLI